MAKLPMICRCGDNKARAETLLIEAMREINSSDDWLPVDKIKDLSVELFIYALNNEDWSEIRIHCDQWFGIVAEKHEYVDGSKVVLDTLRIECDTVLDGLAALYLHVRGVKA